MHDEPHTDATDPSDLTQRHAVPAIEPAAAAEQSAPLSPVDPVTTNASSTDASPDAERAAVASAADARERPGARGDSLQQSGNVQETSPSERPKVNPEPAP